MDRDAPHGYTQDDTHVDGDLASTDVERETYDEGDDPRVTTPPAPLRAVRWSGPLSIPPECWTEPPGALSDVQTRAVFARQLSSSDDEQEPWPAETHVVMRLALAGWLTKACAPTLSDGSSAQLLYLGSMTASTVESDPAATPDAALVDASALRAFVGWHLVDGVWHTNPVPLLAVDALPDDVEIVRDPCGSSVATRDVDAVTQAWLDLAWGSPSTRAESLRTLADMSVLATIPGPWLQWLAGDPSPSEAAGRLHDVADLIEACGYAPITQVVTAMVYHRADLAEDAILTLDGLAGPRVDAARATLQWQLGEYSSAIASARSSLEALPGAAVPLLVQGLVYRDINATPDLATHALDRASTDPTLGARALFELGTAFETLRDETRALEALTHAAEADVAYADPLNAIGCIVFEHGQVERARDAFVSAIARDPNHAAAHNNLGFLLETADENYTQARDAYVRAIALDPRSAGAHFNLGYLLETHFGQLTEARRAYETAVALDPDYTDASSALQSLRNRPDANPEDLQGTWNSSRALSDGTIATVVATFLPGERVTIIERRHDDTATTRRFVYVVEVQEGPQLRLTLTDDEGTSERIVLEFLGRDRIAFFHATDPIYSRLIFERRVGGDMAGVASHPGT